VVNLGIGRNSPAGIAFVTYRKIRDNQFLTLDAAMVTSSPASAAGYSVEQLVAIQDYLNLTTCIAAMISDF